MFENHALHPGDPAQDLDCWPLLELENATVVRYRRGQPDELVDLFDVAENGPFRVKGTLLPVEEKWRGVVKHRDVYGQPLVIPKVATYSMELRDGRIIIWALGAAAWYAISPAKEYRAVFEMLVEKAQLWLFLEERYSRHHGGGKIIKGDVLEVCKDFVEESNGSCRTARTAARLFDKHHRYLLLMMFKPGADFEMWKRTPIFAHYLREFEETVDEVMRFYGHNKRTQSKSTHRDETTERRPTETHNPEPDISSEVSPEASSDEDEDEDEDTPSEHTPEPNASESGKTVSTKGRSTKGRSILRPRRNEIPLEPSSPDDILDSPIEKHLKRRHEPNDTITVGGSSLKRQILSSPPAESRRSSRPPELSRSKLQVRPPRILGDEPYWTCTLDMPRCKHVIANAKTREGRHAIELHYEFHGKIMSDAMETLGVETQAHGGGYQVDNLMRKIQEMSQRWEERKPTPLKGLGE